MKGLITAAGRGTRSGLDGKLRKEMLPIYDLRDGRIVLRPILDVIINRLYEAGINDVGVVLDPNDYMTPVYVEREFPEVRILYQREKRGFGDAVLAGREFIGNERFVLNAGDGMLLDREIQRSCVRTGTEGNVLALMRVRNPENYGTAAVVREKSTLMVNRVMEKSRDPPSSLALCAFYVLTPEVFHLLEADRSEQLDLTHAINAAITSGVPTTARIVRRRDWISMNRLDDYVSVLRKTLALCRKNPS